MKIAILTQPFSAFSGIDRVVELQAEEFNKKGHEITIFCLKAGMKSEDAKIIELGMPSNPTLERIYRLLFFFDRKKIKKYGEILKNYDLVISHFYPMNWLAIHSKKKYGRKWIYHNHGVSTPNLFKNPIERTYLEIFRILNNYTIKKSNKAVSISKYLKEVLKKETGIESKVIYDKIDKKRFYEGISGEEVRKKYNLDNEPICLYVGRISPHKGIHLLIQSFNKVLKKIPEARLMIVGKKTFSGYAKKLENLKKQINSKNIIFTGFVSDEELPHYYAACNIYTTATLWEGFDLPVVEAQALKKPVIAFDIGPHKEVIKNGKLVKVNDIKGFSDSIINTLNHKAF